MFTNIYRESEGKEMREIIALCSLTLPSHFSLSLSLSSQKAMTSTQPPTPPPQPRLSGGDDQHFVHGDKTAASRRRSQSFSSSSPSLSSNSSFESSSRSFHGDHTPICPRSPLQFMGVPFSWEKIPGIPKQLYASKKISDEPSLSQLLPLPPAGSRSNSFRKQSFRDEFSPRKSAGDSFREDPFFAALVECSKEDRHHHGESKVWNSSSKIVTKSFSDRFGFVGLYAAASCKTTCAVSESIVHLPRSRNYDLLSRRSRR